jgi:cell division protein FtsA
MQGAAELASDIFALPVRIGLPLKMEGLADEYCSPVYAAAIGLALEGNDRELKGGVERGDSRPREKGQADLFGKLRDWLMKEFF